jgi:zinc/manganese transport system permease protein
VLDTVDPGFLRSVSGIGAPAHLIFLALVVLNLVAGFHALGTLLAVGLMMLPAIAARFWTVEVGRLCLLAMAIGIGSGLAGLLLSYNMSVPSSPAIILVAGAVYLVSVIAGPRGGLLATYYPGRHREN